MTRRDLITSNEYIEVNVDNTIVSKTPISLQRIQMAKFIIEFRNELLEEQWIPLKTKLPPAHVEVEWYDAMFDKVMVFALKDPSTHDPDFTHWKPIPRRPKEWDEVFANKPKDPILIFYGNPFIKCHKCDTRQSNVHYPKTGKHYCMGCGHLLSETK